MKQRKQVKITNQDLLRALDELEKIPELAEEDKRLIQQLKNEANAGKT